MVNMDDILSILKFCGLFGIVTLCVILILYAVLMWVNPKDKEKRRQKINVLAVFAFAVLYIIFMVYFSKSNESLTAFWGIAKTAFGGLLFGIIFSLVAVLLFIVIWCIKESITTFLPVNRKQEPKDGNAEKEGAGGKGNADEKGLGGEGNAINKKKKYSSIIESMKDSFAIPVIAGGILSLFLILPFLAGEQKGGSLLETWTDGVGKIVNLLDSNTNKTEAEIDDISSSSSGKAVLDDEEDSNGESDEINSGSESTDSAQDNRSNTEEGFSGALISYMLLYIIVLGVGFFVVKILCAIISQALKGKKEDNLIDEYSNPIALLAVGVSILWKFQKGDFIDAKGGEILKGLLESFVMVIAVATIIILTLEIIRLLLEIKKESFIRKEAKYLFISLIGQASLLLLEAMHFVFDTVSVFIGNTVDVERFRIEEYLQEKIISTMRDAVDKAEEPDNKNEKPENKQDTIFYPFDEQRTKK